VSSDSAIVVVTDRFTISHVHCDRNDEYGFAGRDVYLAFHRHDDVPRPLCIVTLCGNWVEWIEVPEGYRRLGIAREVLNGIEQIIGCLELSPVTEEGEAFCNAVCPLGDQETS
jgi:hypothetical protein